MVAREATKPQTKHADKMIPPSSSQKYLQMYLLAARGRGKRCLQSEENTTAVCPIWGTPIHSYTTEKLQTAWSHVDSTTFEWCSWWLPIRGLTYCTLSKRLIYALLVIVWVKLYISLDYKSTWWNRCHSDRGQWCHNALLWIGIIQLMVFR